MGIFSRIGEIVNANISTMLDKAEHPERMVRLMIHEMEDTLTEVKSSAAEVIADRIRTERELKKMRKSREEWIQRAELAVARDRDDLARVALERKFLYEENLKDAEEALQQAEAMVNQYQADIARLEGQLQNAHRRQKELILKQKRAEQSRKLEERINQSNRSQAFLKFEEYAERIDQLEAENEVNTYHNGDQNLEKQFKDLENEGDVDEELRKMKAQKNTADK